MKWVAGSIIVLAVAVIIASVIIRQDDPKKDCPKTAVFGC